MHVSSYRKYYVIDGILKQEENRLIDCLTQRLLNKEFETFPMLGLSIFRSDQILSIGRFNITAASGSGDAVLPLIVDSL